MADLPSSFTITIDGVPIGYNVESGEEKIQAETNAGNPAVFTFDDDEGEGLLKSGDYYLGRFVIEDRSLNPKPVFWFKIGGSTSDGMIQRTIIGKNGGEYIVKNGMSPFQVVDGRVFVDLIEHSPATVEIVNA